MSPTLTTLAPSAAGAIDAQGGRHGAAIVAEAARAGLPLPLACALVEQESSFRNVFGHDAVRNPIPGGSDVTRESYLRYRAWRDAGLGNQGVGITQLTWGAYQDQADRLGGCWKVRNQLRVGYTILADGIRTHGARGALAAYNAGRPDSPQGLRYAAEVLEREERWRARLAGVDVGAPAGTGPRTLRRGLDGPDVVVLQRLLNRYYRLWEAPDLLDPDGDFGALTELAFRRARIVLGLAARRDTDGRPVAIPRDRRVLRTPARRNPEELARAATVGVAFERRLRARFAAERKARGERPKVIRLGLDFDAGRLARNVAVHTTVGHHSAGPVDVSDAHAVRLCREYHRMHRVDRGWAGIGYHACIARSGTIILLRPGWATGAGVEGHNTGTFHVMFNGDFRTDEPSAAQLASYRWFVARGHEIDGVPHQGGKRLGHRDFSGHTTNACPGTNLHPHVKGD